MKLTVACLGALMLLAAPAGAKIPASLYKPSNCTRITPAPRYAVYKCDDGVPISAARTPTRPARWR